MSARVLIVDDHALLSEALASALRADAFEDVSVLSVEGSDEELLVRARIIHPDVVLLDVHLGGSRLSTTLIEPLRTMGAQVVIMTASRDPLVLGACIEAGAAGILDKAQPFGELVAMVDAASRGASVLSPTARDVLIGEMHERRRDERARLAPFDALTPREGEVLAGLLEGRTAEEIARDIDVALATVRTHIRSILSKLRCKSQLAAVAAARRANWTLTTEPSTD
jgi:two-component system, NarL family, nitrate/nitrite response regulator NarL